MDTINCEYWTRKWAENSYIGPGYTFNDIGDKIPTPELLEFVRKVDENMRRITHNQVMGVGSRQVTALAISMWQHMKRTNDELDSRLTDLECPGYEA